MTANSGNDKPKGTPRIIRFRIHWHVFFTHFPISIFLVSFGFMLLHLIWGVSCFELASYLTLIAGAVAMVPTTLTGWHEWKSEYKGFKSRLFLNKIRISFVMIGFSFALVAYRSIFLTGFDSVEQHAIYFTGVTLLLLGALAEGYFGGQLKHH